MKETTVYTILRPSEETECAWCGCPLDVGDTAFEGYYGEVTCGKGCARSWARAHVLPETGEEGR